MPASEDMPSTLQRSPKRAQEVWAKAHDSAVETYGEGEPAHRTAFSALKHQFQKAGDHWEPNTPAARTRPRETAGGVDANASKSDLYETARNRRQGSLADVQCPGRRC